MKRFLLVLMTTILFLSLVSCSEEKSEKTEEKEEVKVDFFAEGIAEYKKGNYRTAVESFTQKIEEAPDYAPAYMHRGESYLAKGTDADTLALAKADFEKALELDVTLIHAKKCTSYILHLGGDTEGAKAMMLELMSLEVTPTYTLVLFVIEGKYCPECGTFEHSEHPDYAEIAKGSYETGDYDSSIESFTKAAEKAPDDALIYMHRGESYLAKGEDTDILVLAKADFEKALELDPALIHAKKCLAYVLYLQGNSDEARKLILEILDSKQENVDVLVLFIIDGKYCPECGRFEHTTHPDVWLEDMSNKEIIEMVKPYVELYYDCVGDKYANPSPYGIKKGKEYFCIVNRDTNEVQLTTLDLINIYDTNKPMFEGRLYNIKGDDITEFVMDFIDKNGRSFGDFYYANKIENFKTVEEIKNNYGKFFSKKIRQNIDRGLNGDMNAFADKERFVEYGMIEFGGELYWLNTMGERGSFGSCINYDSAKVISRTENSCTVKYEHDEFYELTEYRESTWKFGMEDGKFVLLDCSE